MMRPQTSPWHAASRSSSSRGSTRRSAASRSSLSSRSQQNPLQGNNDDLSDLSLLDSQQRMRESEFHAEEQSGIAPPAPFHSNRTFLRADADEDESEVFIGNTQAHLPRPSQQQAPLQLMRSRISHPFSEAMRKAQQPIFVNPATISNVATVATVAPVVETPVGLSTTVADFEPNVPEQSNHLTTTASVVGSMVNGGIRRRIVASHQYQQPGQAQPPATVQVSANKSVTFGVDIVRALENRISLIECEMYRPKIADSIPEEKEQDIATEEKPCCVAESLQYEVDQKLLVLSAMIERIQPLQEEVCRVSQESNAKVDALQSEHVRIHEKLDILNVQQQQMMIPAPVDYNQITQPFRDHVDHETSTLHARINELSNQLDTVKALFVTAQDTTQVDNLQKTIHRVSDEVAILTGRVDSNRILKEVREFLHEDAIERQKEANEAAQIEASATVSSSASSTTPSNDVIQVSVDGSNSVASPLLNVFDDTNKTYLFIFDVVAHAQGNAVEDLFYATARLMYCPHSANILSWRMANGGQLEKGVLTSPQKMYRLRIVKHAELVTLSAESNMPSKWHISIKREAF